MHRATRLFPRLAAWTTAAALALAAGPVRPNPAAAAQAEAKPDEQARQILQATGVRGGLIVHLGCGEGRLTAALAAEGPFLVHGLETDAENVKKARATIRAKGLYGAVSVKPFHGKRLPYVDNLVNLLVAEVPSVAGAEEIMRVLAPGGVAYVKTNGKWTKTVKPRPSEIDEWTHYLYDSTGNPVSRDALVAPPEHQQWVAGPRWARHHDHMSSMNAMVSAGNRLFYIFDEGSTASITLPSHWRLIARDAFNGVVLWKRVIPRWWPRFTPLKSGPAQLPRRLVATAENVYVTLGLDAPASQLDAATGKTLQTYEATKYTKELVLNDGRLFAVTGSPRTREARESKLLYANKPRAPGNPINLRWKDWDRTLVVVETETGKVAWRMSSTILPGTLAVAGDSAFFHNGKSIVAVDRKTGEGRWVSEPVPAVNTKEGIPTGFMPSLVVDHGVIVFAGGPGYRQHMKGETDTMVALRAKDGEILWKAPHYPSGYQSPEDLLVIDRNVLSPFSTWLKGDSKNNHVVGRNLMTGEVAFDSEPDVADPVWFIHHRCHPSKATEHYLLMSKEGVEFIDSRTRRWKIHHWVRGACIYGIMPANGLLYAPMHACACSADMKLYGLNALAAAKARSSSNIDVKKHVLTKGPAFGKVEEDVEGEHGDWPTFRHDAARSGVASCSPPDSLKQSWQTPVGGRLSAPVVAGGRVYVAEVDRHTLHVLDANTGEALWTFTAEGRIDSPPTVYQGMVLFGSRDGCVYNLRASDGALVWRFRAVADDRRLTAWGQVESVWPVHGSTLIRNGEAWFVAGRSVFLDGGLQMFRVNPETGDVFSRATFDGKAPDGGPLTGAEQKRLVGLPDVLSASEGHLFMRAGVILLDGDTIRKRLLPKRKLIRYKGGGRPGGHNLRGEAHPHLFSSYGFLDDSWMHRSYWVWNDTCSHRHGYSTTGRHRPAGRILVCDDKNVYGFGRQQRYFNWTTPMEYRLFARAKEGEWKKALIWERKSPGLLARALVLVGDTLFAAGPPDVLDETQKGIRNEAPETLRAMKKQEEALAGRGGGILTALHKKDGEVKQQIDMISPPVFDGMIAANGRLYVALKNGAVLCITSK